MKKILAALLILFGFLRFTSQPLLEGTTFSKTFYDDKGRLLRLTLSQDEKYRIFTAISDFPSEIKEAFLLKEDKYFYFHFGVNPMAVAKRLFNSSVYDARRSGASTITMQLVRLQHNLQTQDIKGKLWQMILALWTEVRHSKSEILEAYLNLAPFGGNIEGVSAAALIYFKRAVAELTLTEILSLVTLPQNPGISLSQVQKRRVEQYRNWVNYHPEDKNKSIEFALPLQMHTVREIPFEAPHFTSSLLQKDPHLLNYDTTLNLELQKIIQENIDNYLSEKKKVGVNNAVAVLIDNRAQEIKAMLGSANFFNAEIDGQVNGVLAKRSPGSALKPFIYGLAIEQGVIHPETLLKDTPQSFGPFDPENFDLDFKGPLAATEALNLSRNVPAVYLSAKINPSIYKFLTAAKINLPKSEEYYGLAIALGGTEVSALELAKLYSMIFHHGAIYEPRWLRSDKLTHFSQEHISAESFFLVREMLEKAIRPDESFDQGWLKNRFAVAWKTGTSFGFRDAWTAGIFGPYTLVIWIGNFNNEANPTFVGREIAAPLFFRIADSIGHHFPQDFQQNFTPAKVLNVKKVKVCAVSGALPNEHCPHTKISWYIPGKSPIKTCSLHREIWIDRQTGLRACEFNAKRTLRAIAEFWPSDILNLFSAKGLARKTAPPYDPSCKLNSIKVAGSPPEITSPKKDHNYELQHKNSSKNKIALSAVSDGDIQKLFWFVNEEFIGSASPSETLLWPARPGEFVLKVIDDKGRADSMPLRVGVAQ